MPPLLEVFLEVINYMNNRIISLVEKMNIENIDYFLITDPYSIYYLTGYLNFPHERFFGLLVDRNHNHKLYLNRLFMPYNNLDVIWYSDDIDPISLINIDGIVAVDDKLTAKFLLPLITKFSNVHFKNGSYLINQLRNCKDNIEIDRMIQSSKINDQVMEFVKNQFKVNTGLSELEMAQLIKNKFMELGCSDVSFNPIVAYGKNGANPHHDNSHSKLEVGDSIIIDIGGIYNDYCSDMTRTFFYKSVNSEQELVYNLCKQANLAGISLVKPGIKYSEIDFAVREVIDNAGYGKYFTHRTGHSIGLETHESISVSSDNDMIVEVGHIFSIEPGIYLDGKFGVRIEDLVLVTESGCIVLNECSKELEIL